jgi:hypothetical protein
LIQIAFGHARINTAWFHHFNVFYDNKGRKRVSGNQVSDKLNKVNVLALSAQHVRQFLTKCCIPQVRQTSYLPDMAPSNILLSIKSKLKRTFKGKNLVMWKEC